VCLIINPFIMKKRKIYPYNPELKQLARNLRNKSTLSEVLLWNQLKNGKMMGYDFHRQKPILNFILDFFCHELELAIEIDGHSHNFEDAYYKDIKRQGEVEHLGITFLRFYDIDVKVNMQNILRTIENWIKDFEELNGGHTPNPPEDSGQASQEGNSHGSSAEEIRKSGALTNQINSEEHTPNPSQEGNSHGSSAERREKSSALSKEINSEEHTPNPPEDSGQASQEGNSHRSSAMRTGKSGALSKEINSEEHTPNPSQEGNSHRSSAEEIRKSGALTNDINSKIYSPSLPQDGDRLGKG
jgi:very-short-patch-repair endonuclease